MLTVQFRIPAEPGARFTKAAADRMVGQTMPFKLADELAGTGKVTAARLGPRGASVVVTLNVTKGPA